MSLKFNTKKYIEESSSLNEFACVYIHVPQEEEISELRGRMYTMVNFKMPEGSDAISASNVFLDKLEEIFFSNQLVGIPTILEKSIKGALFALDVFFKANEVDDNIIFDFAAAVIKDDVLYIAKVEEGNIYIIRDNKSLDLGRSLLDVSNPKLVENGSGILQVGDKIVLANKSADELVSDWNLLSRYSESEISRLINPAKDGYDKIAFLIIEVEEFIEEHLVQNQANSILDKVSIASEDTKQVTSDKVEDTTIMPEIIEEPNPPEEFVQKNVPQNNSLMNKVLGINDKLADWVVKILKVIISKIRGTFKYVYGHREDIRGFIISNFKKLLDFISSLVNKRKGSARNSSDGIKGIEGFSYTRKRVATRITKDKKILVPVILVCCFFLSSFLR